MKRLIVGLAATTLLGGGLVGFSAESANAACPYTGCVETYTKVSAPDTVQRGGTARICLKVTTPSERQPKGKVSIRVVRSKGDYKFVDAKTYNDSRECFRTTKLKKLGKYVVHGYFDRKPGSGFRDSDNVATFRVTR